MTSFGHRSVRTCGSFDPIAIAAVWKAENVLPEAGALMALSF